MKAQRSGFRSISGVPSRQSSPRTIRFGPSTETSFARTVPIGFGRTGEPASGETEREELPVPSDDVSDDPAAFPRIDVTKA